MARQHFSCCGTCGAHEIHDEIDLAEQSGRPARGFTFFHIQDTEHAVGGESLYLSYGAADQDQVAAVAIGHEVVDVLSRHGLSPELERQARPPHRAPADLAAPPLRRPPSRRHRLTAPTAGTHDAARS